MLRTAATLTALVLFTPTVADRVAFAPEDGTAVQKSFHVSITQELDELSVMVGGADMSDMIGDFELTISVDTTVEVLDTYVTTADGRPQELKRLYDSILVDSVFEFVSEFESGDESQAMESELEGQTVVFEWDADDEAYTVAFETGEGDPLMLEGLIEDMDFRELLPTEEVEVDDEWEVDPDALSAILAPGGSLGLFLQEGDDEEVMRFIETLAGTNFEELIDALFEGEITAIYKGVREVDGRDVARIELGIDIDSTTDLVEYILAFLDGLEGDGPPDDFELSTADLGVIIEGGATLEWDVEGGHFHHFETMCDATVAFHLVAGDGSASGDVRLELSGAIEIAADASR